MRISESYQTTCIFYIKFHPFKWCIFWHLYIDVQIQHLCEFVILILYMNWSDIYIYIFYLDYRKQIKITIWVYDTSVQIKSNQINISIYIYIYISKTPLKLDHGGRECPTCELSDEIDLLQVAWWKCQRVNWFEVKINVHSLNQTLLDFLADDMAIDLYLLRLSTLMRDRICSNVKSNLITTIWLDGYVM